MTRPPPPVRQGTRLLLADRAIEGRTAGLRNPDDRPAAARPRAVRTFAVIDRKGVLEIAERAVGLTVIAQGRAAGFDRFLKDGVDRSRQSAGGAGRTAARVGQSARRAR